MKNLRDAHPRFRILLLLLVAWCALGLTTWSSVAAPPLTITVVNNSSWEIHHLYLAPANTDNWGPDQLNGSVISPGGSRTLSVSWDQSTVKLVGEDQDGCFRYATIEATGSQTWTIEASRNCGG